MTPEEEIASLRQRLSEAEELVTRAQQRGDTLQDNLSAVQARLSEVEANLKTKDEALVNPEFHWRKQWEIQTLMKNVAEAKAEEYRQRLSEAEAKLTHWTGYFGTCIVCRAEAAEAKLKSLQDDVRAAYDRRNVDDDCSSSLGRIIARWDGKPEPSEW